MLKSLTILKITLQITLIFITFCYWLISTKSSFMSSLELPFSKNSEKSQRRKEGRGVKLNQKVFKISNPKFPKFLIAAHELTRIP